LPLCPLFAKYNLNYSKIKESTNIICGAVALVFCTKMLPLNIIAQYQQIFGKAILFSK
jgi:hypothetical protein